MTNSTFVLFILDRIRTRAAAQEREPDEGGWFELAYSAGMIALTGWSVLLFGVAIGALSLIVPDTDPSERLAGLIMGACMLAAGLVVLNEGRARVWVGPEGIEASSAWKGRVYLDWDDVEEVAWSNVNQWYRISGAAGTIRVHAWMGTTELRDHLRRHLDEALAGDALQAQGS